jgi:hypothetical protein
LPPLTIVLATLIVCPLCSISNCGICPPQMVSVRQHYHVQRPLHTGKNTTSSLIGSVAAFTTHRTSPMSAGLRGSRETTASKCLVTPSRISLALSKLPARHLATKIYNLICAPHNMPCQSMALCNQRLVFSRLSSSY